MYRMMWLAVGLKDGGSQPEHRTILTVCSGRVSLPGARSEDHSERSVGYLEELEWPLRG